MVEELDGSTTVLVADVGGNNVKLRLSNRNERRLVPTGPSTSAAQMVESVIAATKGWSYGKVTVGCPGPVARNRLTLEPVNLGPGWVDFDFGKAFNRPTKVINDAAMQALGSYEGGKMLFLGLGTGLGTALVVTDTVIPMELAHLVYRDDLTYEDFLGQRGIERLGQSTWLEVLDDAVIRLKAALVADYVVLGGGNIRLIDQLPPGCRAGNNDNAFDGGFRLWQERVVLV